MTGKETSVLCICRFGDACRIAGVTKNKLKRLLQAGLLQPSRRGGSRGGHHRFSINDLIQIRTLSYLSELGFNEQGMANALKLIQPQSDKDVAIVEFGNSGMRLYVPVGSIRRSIMDAFGEVAA